MRVEVYAQGSVGVHYAYEKHYSKTSSYVYDNKTDAAEAGNDHRQSLASDPKGTYDGITMTPTNLYKVMTNPVDVVPNTYTTYNGSVGTQKHPTTGKWAYVVNLDVKRVFKQAGP